MEPAALATPNRTRRRLPLRRRLLFALVPLLALLLVAELAIRLVRAPCTSVRSARCAPT